VAEKDQLREIWWGVCLKQTTNECIEGKAGIERVVRARGDFGNQIQKQNVLGTKVIVFFKKKRFNATFNQQVPVVPPYSPTKYR
jgi:hypothetical protein